MKFLIALNLILSITLGYFVYQNHKSANEPHPKIITVQDEVVEFKKEIDESRKLLLDLKARVEKLDKNVNGHKVGDSLRDQIGALQSNLEALEKKVK